MLAKNIDSELKNGDNVSFEEYKNIEKEYDGKVEYIEGKIWLFAGGITDHSIIINRLTRLISEKLKDKQCEALAEFPWYYKDEKNRELVLYPDVVIVCDWKNYLGKKYYGNIEFVIEVLSESTENYDRKEKLKKYKKLGVKEYILVNHKQQSIEIFNLSLENPFGETRYLNLDSKYVYKSNIFENVEIKLSDIFTF